MGHIGLATPVSRIWIFKGVPSSIGLMLDLSPRQLEKVLYFASYIVTYVNTDLVNNDIVEGQVLSEKEYNEYYEKYGKDAFEAGMGAEAIKTLLEKIDVEGLAESLKAELEDAQGQKKARIIK